MGLGATAVPAKHGTRVQVAFSTSLSTATLQVMVFLTAVMVSVVTAGIPIEGIGIVVGVDRILDMSRTVVNVTGDSVGTLVVSRSEGLLDTDKRLA